MFRITHEILSAQFALSAARMAAEKASRQHRLGDILERELEGDDILLIDFLLYKALKTSPLLKKRLSFGAGGHRGPPLR